MSRYKRKPLPPWVTAQDDGMDKRFIQVGGTFFQHKKVRGLSSGAFMVYQYMVIQAGGKPAFQMPQKDYLQFTTKPTFRRAVEELTKAGFIEVERKDNYPGTPNQYRFSKRWRSDA